MPAHTLARRSPLLAVCSLLLLTAAVSAGYTSLVTAADDAAGGDPFSGSAQFERWSHFHDYGVPGTRTDPLNQAAIADGTCRLLGGDAAAVDGFHFWRSPDRVHRVLAALEGAPPTDRPSLFVLQAARALRTACADSSPSPAASAGDSFPVDQVGASVQNWFRALCAPEGDVAWEGTYDPAYQPQQVALTAGFVCIATCDARRAPLPGTTMAVLARKAAAGALAREICAAVPWVVGRPDFGKVATREDLARLTAPWAEASCGCRAEGAPARSLRA